jgi:glycosyltransferase involved in cell wall biosynthesis
MANSKLISVVAPCYNEEANVEVHYHQVKEVFKKLANYDYEHIFIDNASTDGTVRILKEIAQKDQRVKIIVNARNFGWIRSPFYGMLQANGDAVILIASDLQDPPPVIAEFLKKWEEGYKIVLGIKAKSKEPFWMHAIRKLYYKIYQMCSEKKIVEQSTGFGLYDRVVIENFRNMREAYPFLKSLIAEIGFEKALVEFTQERRTRGISSANFYALYDAAMSGITSDSRVLIRIATMFGFAASVASLLIAAGYLLLKILYWERYELGMASVAIGLFFFASVQLLFIGIVGEYVGCIYTQVKNRPLVIEKERINF